MSVALAGGAAWVLQSGGAIFPVAPDGKRAKAPLTHDGFKGASRDPAVIERWIAEFPGCAWGVAPGTCGEPIRDEVQALRLNLTRRARKALPDVDGLSRADEDARREAARKNADRQAEAALRALYGDAWHGGFVVLDLDRKPGEPDGVAAFAAWCGENGLDTSGLDGLPRTRTVTTPSGGVHLWFRAPVGSCALDGKPGIPGVDLLRHNTGYVLLDGPGVVSYKRKGATISGQYALAVDTEPAPLPTPILAARRTARTSEDAQKAAAVKEGQGIFSMADVQRVMDLTRSPAGRDDWRDCAFAFLAAVPPEQWGALENAFLDWSCGGERDADQWQGFVRYASRLPADAMVTAVLWKYGPKSGEARYGEARALGDELRHRALLHGLRSGLTPSAGPARVRAPIAGRGALAARGNLKGGRTLF